MSDLIIISNNSLSTTARCTTETVLAYKFMLTGPEERAELRSGGAVHLALAAHFRGRSVAVALSYFDMEYEAFARANVPSTDRLSFENVRAILKRWLKKNPVDSLPFEILEVEVKFRLPLVAATADAPGIDYQGVIDGIVRERARNRVAEVQALENKTTGSYVTGEKWPRQFGFESQITSYTWALAEREERVSAGWVNAIQLTRLPSSDRKCREHATSYAECGPLHAQWRFLGPLERKAWHLETWKAQAAQLARRHAAMLARYETLEQVQESAPQEGRFTGKCTYCQFFTFCRAGRQPRHAKTMLSEKEKRPPFARGIGGVRA